ncbi:MAG: hypothetical protein HC774_05485 [Sphingomonadales bacterium]|nr:hypothetical protein [Sphingomonadales bacterium]
MTLLQTNARASAWAAYVFATEPAFFEIAAAAPYSENREKLLTCVVPIERMRSFAREHKWKTDYYALPQMLKAYGSAAWPLVIDALDNATDKYQQERLAPIITFFPPRKFCLSCCIDSNISPRVTGWSGLRRNTLTPLFSALAKAIRRNPRACCLAGGLA